MFLVFVDKFWNLLFLVATSAFVELTSHFHRLGSFLFIRVLQVCCCSFSLIPFRFLFHVFHSMFGRLERTLASTASETTNSDFSSSGTSKHYGCS